MKKKAYIIEGFTIENLIIICKRDGNAPAYIESELLKLIDVANDLRSLIKLYKIQSFVRNTFTIKKEEIPLFYDHITVLLEDIGQLNKSIADASSALRYFLLRLKEEEVVF